MSTHNIGFPHEIRKIQILLDLKKKKQEAHGPRLAHLCDISTADMQIICNIFPILSLQLMKGSSFKQFLILKKRDHLNKLTITFQQ